jgi:hypothetical protein
LALEVDYGGCAVWWQENHMLADVITKNMPSNVGHLKTGLVQGTLGT